MIGTVLEADADFGGICYTSLMPTELILLVPFFLLLLLSAFFSGTETAFTAVSETALQTDERRRDPRSDIVLKMIRNRGNIIGAILIGNNVVNTVLPVLATVIFEGLLSRAPHLPAWLGPVLAGAISIVFLLVCGEVVPKNVAVAHATSWALRAARPTRFLVTILSPLISLLNLFSRLVMSLVGRPETNRDNAMIQELLSMSRLSRQAGAIDHLEAKLLNRAAILNDYGAGDILVPRQEVCTVSAQATVEEIRRVFLRDQYSRIPAYGDTPDHIIGILHFKEIVPLPTDQWSKPPATSLLYPPMFVPESKSIGSLMEEMRSGGTHLAVVIDEYSAPLGIVTLEDILEFLVGAIRDEFDSATGDGASSAGTPGKGETTGSSSRELPGRLSIIHFERQFKIELPAELKAEASTLAGLVLNACGSLPEPGFSLQLPGLRLTVVKVGRQRIERLLVDFTSISAG